MHVHNKIKTFHTATYKERTNNNKHVICQLYSIKIQKQVESNPKQPSCKKGCGSLECCCEQSDDRLRVKFLITTIQVNLVPNPSETWRRQHKRIVIIKLLPLVYTITAICWLPLCISHLFFTTAFLGAALFFYS